ncbi:deoxycytidine triphosphate deaminase [Gammaproteobacteria bacterium 45_16_T64]|nr:deoxycytidine triphosphate deaminase [Gammaproteobacteria bacterium 45_16_T64]
MADINQTTEIEAKVLQRLLAHLDERKDVQNIELMNLAGFCRNCLSKWYVAAADELGVEVGNDQAREIIYGMPYSEWKDKYQKEATPEQLAAFNKK